MPEQTLDEGLPELSVAERRAAWLEIRAAIEEARDARTVQEQAEPSAESSGSDQGSRDLGNDEPTGVLDRQYIEDAIEEIRPLLGECYELALAEAPELAGRLVLGFSIGGEPDVGGIVEEVLIADDSDIHHSMLDECVRETIYTIELPAPEAGGTVNVTYPVTFAPDEVSAEDEQADPGASEGLR